MGPDHHPGEFLLEGGDLRRLLVPVLSLLVVLHQPPVDALPGGDRLLPELKGLPTGRRRQGRGLPAPEDRRPDRIRHHVGKEHLGGVAVPDLERLEVPLSLHLIDVQQELRGVPDPGDGAVAVPAAGEGEIGDRIELEQKRAGYLEEVREKFIRRPFDDERREAVEDVEDLPPLRLDDMVEVAAEGVKAGMGIDRDRFQPVDGRQDRGVGGKTKVDRPPVVTNRLPGEGLREVPVIVEAVHLPDDIVAEAQPLEHLIEGRKAARDDSGWDYFHLKMRPQIIDIISSNFPPLQGEGID